MRTILVTITASLLAGLIAHVVDELMGMQRLTAYGGGAGSLLRLFVLAVIMLPIVAAVMVRARVPEAQAALAAIPRLDRCRRPAAGRAARPGGPPSQRRRWQTSGIRSAVAPRQRHVP